MTSTQLVLQVLCQVPATVISKFFPPRLWLGAATIGWGACSTLMVAWHGLFMGGVFLTFPARLLVSISRA